MLLIGHNKLKFYFTEFFWIFIEFKKISAHFFNDSQNSLYIIRVIITDLQNIFIKGKMSRINFRMEPCHINPLYQYIISIIIAASHDPEDHTIRHYI